MFGISNVRNVKKATEAPVENDSAQVDPSHKP